MSSTGLEQCLCWNEPPSFNLSPSSSTHHPIIHPPNHPPSFYPPTCVCIHPSAHPSIHPPFIYPSRVTILYFHPPFIHPPFHSDIHLSISLNSIQPAIHPAAMFSISRFIYVLRKPSGHKSTYLSIHPTSLLHAGCKSPLPQTSHESVASFPPYNTLKVTPLGSGWEIPKVPGNLVCSYWEIIYLCSLENENHSRSC